MHDKCPVCGAVEINFGLRVARVCGWTEADPFSKCREAHSLAIERATRIAELEKELRELNTLLKDALKAWDSEKDSRVGKLLRAALDKDFRYSYRPDLKEL